MIDRNRVPEHVAIIMDGNGRWAKKRLLPRVAGHNAGMLAMKEIVKVSSTLGVKHLTVYAFSTENWKRTEDEISGIFKLLIKYVDSELDELNENNVKVRILGDYSVIPKAAIDRLEKSLKTTCNNTGLQFNIALNYGSRAEIVRAVNRINRDVKEGILPEDTEVTEELISRYLYTGEENGNIPDPDLIIRTSGEERLSNFLLWQSAYSEFAFTDVLWPDFTPTEYERLIEVYQNRDRRFGGRK
ncbi:MAG: isoprenyl transferase [Eubacteriaceae bacterium]|nr:isoprenyl transferase [Eubacteriaceae bacterium]